jgi:hypothetical protein
MNDMLIAGALEADASEIFSSSVSPRPSVAEAEAAVLSSGGDEHVIDVRVVRDPPAP